jgi:hypothetical protein
MTVTPEIDPGDLRYLTCAVWQVSVQVGRGFPSEDITVSTG